MQAKEALQASSAEAHNDRLEMERRLREAQALNTTLEKQCRELETDAKLANDQLNSTKAILSNFQNALGNPGEARANLERLKENVAMEQQRVAELLAQRAKDVDVGLGCRTRSTCRSMCLANSNSLCRAVLP